MEATPLLFIKINNVRNSKALNGTDGALVCDVTVDNVVYRPIDVVLRRPKSGHGLQKNSLVFQLPAMTPRFDVTFRKKYAAPREEGIIARAAVTLQYSSLPSLPRRSSYNSLVVGSPNGSPRHSPQYTTSSSGASPSAPIAIGNGNSSTSTSSQTSPLLLSGSPGLSGSPQYYLPPPYSLSAPVTPTDLSGSPNFISYSNGSRYQNNPNNHHSQPMPIFASASTSSPTLATVHNDEEQLRIESSLKWYRLTLLGEYVGMAPSISSTSLTGGASDGESTFSSDEPEIQLQIAYELNNTAALVRLKQMHRDLLDMVVTSRLGVVHAACDVVDITAAAALAKSLVDVFHCHHKLLHLLKSFMKKEVAACHDPGTLFRSNSVAMKMVVAYGHKTAQHYLQQTLTPLVVELCASPLSLEVDPVKLPPGEDVDTNLANLRGVSQRFFDRIIGSIDSCPKSIVEICYYFKKIVSRKFPGHWRAAVGGFIFLRLLCPACVSPENAGIISAGRVGIAERRALVLVAKCLQNLSNQVTFNQPYMAPVNDFITGNLAGLDDFFTRLAARPAEDQTIDGMMVSDDSFADSIVYVQQFLEKNVDKVSRALDLNAALTPNDRPRAERILEGIEASKKASMASTASFTHLLNKQRSNSAGASSPPKEGGKKLRSSSENKEYREFPKWSTITKGLRTAKQTVITPTLNVISNNFPTKVEEEIILNTDTEWREPGRSAAIVGQQLLYSLVIMCKNNRHPDTLSMNGQPVNWAVLQQTPEFNSFARQVGELQCVIFDNTSVEHLASFFINIFNLMIIHLHFLVGPPNSEVRRKLYSLHKYNIGGSLYSLNDIHQGILRANPKNTLTRVRQIRGGDKRRAHVLPLDPRYHFALFCVNVTLPCLRVYSPDSFVEDLHKAGEEFCTSKVDICIKKKEISLPRLFSQYGTDFGKSRAEMLKWIFQFLTSSKRTELLELLEKPSYICLYRTESWNPITYKTKFLVHDVEEKVPVAVVAATVSNASSKLPAEKEQPVVVEKKLTDKEKVMRRKSRSLTHGNRLAPTNKKDSTALSLINTLRQNAQQSTKQILASLNDVVKKVSETLDVKYVTLVLDSLKTATKQLSFNEWQKTSGISTNEKPSVAIKPQTQLYSNHQMACLSPSARTQYAPIFQELYALTLSIEKETNKFLDFLDISSFAQSNDIAELLADVSEQTANRVRDIEVSHCSVEPIKEAMLLTVIYFSVTVGKAVGPPHGSDDQQLAAILKELILDSAKVKKDTMLLSNRLSDIGEQISRCTTMDQLVPIIAKIERVGKLVAIVEEQTVTRYSPRQSPRG
eukprot:gene3480-3972_t